MGVSRKVPTRYTSKSSVLLFLVVFLLSAIASAEPTSLGEQDYVDHCAASGVPTPPEWNYEKAWHGVDTQWIRQPGTLTPTLAAAGAAPAGKEYFSEIFYYQSQTPRGVCIMITRSVFPENTTPEDGPPEYLQLVGTICQGLDTGKACIWDSGINYVSGGVTPDQTLNFGDGVYDNTSSGPVEDRGKPVTVFAGGANLSSADQCTDCHRGENVFFVHPGTQLDVGRVYPNVWMDPIVPTGWPENPPPIPTSGNTGCTECHRPLSGGRFPETNSQDIAYCNKLVETFGLTMPMGIVPFPQGTTLPALQAAWPEYYSLLAACNIAPSLPDNEAFEMMSMNGPAPLNWIPDNGTVSDVSGETTDGGGSMSVNASGYVRLDSISTNTWVFESVGSSVDLDVFVPPNGQPNQHWLGSVDLFLTIPSANMFNTYVGHGELTPGGTGWRTLTFALSSQAQAALSGTHPDVRWGIATNTPGAAPALLLDNMRFSGAQFPGAPIPNLPIRFDFDHGEIWPEFEGDVSSVGTSGDVSYTGSSALRVMLDGDSDGRVWVEPTSEIQPGSIITFRVYVPDDAPVVAIQPYVADNNWVWDETWNTSFPRGAWLTITTTLSPQATLPIRELGVKFYLDDVYAGPVYIDAVTW